MHHYLIYDNGATLKNRGTDFTLGRFTGHLRQFVRKYGRNGFIFFFDFAEFFSNILTQELKVRARKYLPDCLQRKMYEQFIDVFGEKGLGLGSQVSQISAVFYTNTLDHYIKDTLGVKYYAKYMDDGYIICESLEKLKILIDKLYKMCNRLHIALNTKKCRIIKLTKHFRFLKNRFFITQTGKVIQRVNREVAKKERHKLKSFVSFIKDGKMTHEYVNNCFHAWLHSQTRGKNYRLRLNMVRYYNSLYGRYNFRFTHSSKRHKSDCHAIRHIAMVA